MNALYIITVMYTPDSPTDPIQLIGRNCLNIRNERMDLWCCIHAQQLLTLDDVYHDMSRPGIIRRACVIGAVRKLHLLHNEYWTVSLHLESNTRFVIIVYHTYSTIPEYVVGRFRGCHQLAFQTQAGALFHMEIRTTWYHRVRFRDV